MSLQPAESRLVVPFAGTVSGRAPLTWGEKALLQDQRETGLALNATGAQNLAPGTTVESAAARLGRLLSDQPALRVRLGTDEDGSLYQQVHDCGEVARRGAGLRRLRRPGTRWPRSPRASGSSG